MTSKNNNEHIDPEEKTSPTSGADTTSPESKAENKDNAQPAKPAQASQSSRSDAASEPGKSTSNAEKQAKRGVKLGIVAIVISIALSGGLAYHASQKDAAYQAQISALQTQLAHAQTAMQSDLDSMEQQTVKKATEITHRAETVLTQQQKSIESLQLAIADVKGRRPNDWLLAEANYLVKLAGRKLFLEHDAETATRLMESADQRIAALNDPSLVPLRKAMANDITDLKSIPLVDRDGLVLRITALQQKVDRLPLANALLPKEAHADEQPVSDDINDWQTNLMTSLKDFSENFITFRTRDGNVVPLLTPEQDFYLKENIKAKLETAIRAVYQEQQPVYTSALSTALEWSGNYLNQKDKGVRDFNAVLEQLSKQEIQVEYPVELETQDILNRVITERLRREVTTLITEEK
ncbi:uroporphyrinogen-III C-methyltransferase [Vibrio proteolyticus]